jgi:hypothetical protein
MLNGFNLNSSFLRTRLYELIKNYTKQAESKPKGKEK